MTYVAPTKSFCAHQARARSLREWEVAFWWMGLMCTVFATALYAFDMVGRSLAMAGLYWVIATAREACDRAAERHTASMRDELNGQKEGGRA